MKFGIMMSLSLTQCRELYVLPQLHPPVRLPNQCLFPLCMLFYIVLMNNLYNLNDDRMHWIDECQWNKDTKLSNRVDFLHVFIGIFLLFFLPSSSYFLFPFLYSLYYFAFFFSFLVYRFVHMRFYIRFFRHFLPLSSSFSTRWYFSFICIYSSQYVTFNIYTLHGDCTKIDLYSFCCCCCCILMICCGCRFIIRYHLLVVILVTICAPWSFQPSTE